jgi:adenosylcobinamide-phosphate synthase
MNITLSIILAIILDYLLGEPKRYHPLVGFGRVAACLEKQLRIASQSPAKVKARGLLGWALLTLPLPLILSELVLPVIGQIWLNSVILYFCIAPSSLKQHALKVYHSLQNQSLSAAQQQVGRMVSRETRRMSRQQVQKAVIESVLENGADAVFAPIFWFVIAGPAGALFYRLSNTLDAMWGYKNDDFFYFGRVAARMDDLLNFLPARLTALSYALTGTTCQAIKCWQNQAAFLDSPNAGPVMTAGAGAINVRLGGPAYYHGRLKEKSYFGTQRATQAKDILRANSLINKSLLLWVMLIAVGDYFA